MPYPYKNATPEGKRFFWLFQAIFYMMVIAAFSAVGIDEGLGFIIQRAVDLTLDWTMLWFYLFVSAPGVLCMMLSQKPKKYQLDLDL